MSSEERFARDKSILVLSLLLVGVFTLFAQPAPQSKILTPADAAKIPTVLRFCAQHCLTFTLEDGQLTNRTNLAGQRNEKRVLTVESFTREKVVIHRADTGSNPLTADYMGRMSDDGNSVSGNGWKMTWGAALNTQPGDDNERAVPDAIAAARYAAPETVRADAAHPKLGPVVVPYAAGLRLGAATPALGPVPAPYAHDFKVEPSRGGDPDIGGIWQQDAEPANRYHFPPAKILIVAFRNQLIGLNLERLPFLHAGAALMTGTYSSPDSFKANVKDFNDSGVVGWYAADLNFPSAGHLRMFVKAFNEEKRFTRISTIAPGELACDIHNPSRASGQEAVARGYVYSFHHIDDQAAACWFYVGAVAGDPAAEHIYADTLSEGKYAKKDDAQAFRLYQRSALRGYDPAMSSLADAFDSGGVLPESNRRSNYWGARSVWLDPNYVHTDKFLRITPWALDTALPCDATNPKYNDGDYIFRAGRAAFMARAGDVATCWFQLSSSRGDSRADVYLGVIYYFGIGVEQNPALGLERLKKASDAKDPWGKMYLANFFRWGVGVPVNRQLGDLMLQEVNQMPEGVEVFTRVQNTVGYLTSIFLGIRGDPDLCGRLADAAPQDRFAAQEYKTRGCSSAGPVYATGDRMVDPEEIFPERFDAITLETDMELKERANQGWVRLIP